MPPVYSQACINNRLQGVITTIDASGNGLLKLLDSLSTVLCTVTLSYPSGTVSGGVLTFSAASGSGSANGTAVSAIITNGAGTTVISGLTVGIPLSGADVIVNNGVNSTVITAGAIISFVSGQIIGS